MSRFRSILSVPSLIAFGWQSSGLEKRDGWHPWPFTPAIQKATRLPVFDFVTLTNLMYEVVCRKEFPEYFD
jgi:hypothetical protein